MTFETLTEFVLRTLDERRLIQALKGINAFSQFNDRLPCWKAPQLPNVDQLPMKRRI